MSIIDDLERDFGWRMRALQNMPNGLIPIFYPSIYKDNGDFTLNLPSFYAATEDDDICEDKEIWAYRFPYYNNIGTVETKNSRYGRIRPVIIVRNKKLGDWVIRIGTRKEFAEQYIRTGIFIEDPEKYNLDRESYIMPNIFRPLDESRLKEKIGVIDDETYDETIRRMITSYDNFTNPWELMEWLKSYQIKPTSHSSGNNNKNKLQSVKDVINTRSANCVDIATCAHEMCNQMGKRLKHTIAITQFQNKKNPNSWRGHVYCVFQVKDGSSYAFRYIPEEGRGDIKKYDDVDSLEDVAMNKEVPWLLAHFRDEFGTKKVRSRTILLTRDELRIWDRCVKTGMTQKELLETLQKAHESANDYITRESFIPDEM